jgi:hypothetical protein
MSAIPAVGAVYEDDGVVAHNVSFGMHSRNVAL